MLISVHVLTNDTVAILERGPASLTVTQVLAAVIAPMACIIGPSRFDCNRNTTQRLGETCARRLVTCALHQLAGTLIRLIKIKSVSAV